MDLSAVGTDVERVIISEEDLQSRIREMAAQIDSDYLGRDLILVGVLKGAVMAMADLARALQRHIEMDWMAVSSYGSGTKSSGVVRILKDLDRDLYLTATETVQYGLADEIATNEVMHEIIEMTNKAWDLDDSKQQRLLEVRSSNRDNTMAVEN